MLTQSLDDFKSSVAQLYDPRNNAQSRRAERYQDQNSNLLSQLNPPINREKSESNTFNSNHPTINYSGVTGFESKDSEKHNEVKEVSGFEVIDEIKSSDSSHHEHKKAGIELYNPTQASNEGRYH